MSNLLQKLAHSYGDCLRRARVGAGVSLREAANDTGLPAVRLGEIERGVGKTPTAIEHASLVRAWEVYVRSDPPRVTLHDHWTLYEISRHMEKSGEKVKKLLKRLDLGYTDKVRDE